MTFTAFEWGLLALAAGLVGVAKTAVPALGTIPVAVFAAVLPAKESTGALLVLLLVGDVTAIFSYHLHTDWGMLRRLIPSVLAGVIAGAVLMHFAGNEMVGRLIGAVLIGMVALNVAQHYRPPSADRSAKTSRLSSIAYGSLGGFTTMAANAAGPVMSMYFVASRMSVQAFLGTAAWFFFSVNLLKVPFSIALGLIAPESLLMNLLLVPALLVGAWVGRAWAGNMRQAWFNSVIIAITFVSGCYLLFRAA